MTKDDWIKQSLNLVSKHGANILKIDSLCKKLKVTKGSFYHHFKNHKLFIDTILEYWYTTFTLDIIEQIQKHKNDPLKQIELLNEIIYSKDLNIEIEFRAWALRDKSFHNYIQKIDEARIKVIENIQEKLNPSYSLENRKLISKYIYTQFIGSLFVIPRVSKNEQKNLDDLFVKLLTNKENIC